MWRTINKTLAMIQKKRETNNQSAHGAIAKRPDQPQPHKQPEPPPDYDGSGTTTHKSSSDRQNGGKTWNAAEVRSLEAQYVEERDKLKMSLEDAKHGIGQYEKERRELEAKINKLKQGIKEANEYCRKENEKILEEARYKIDALKQEHSLEVNTLKSDLQSHRSQVKKLTLEKKEALTRYDFPIYMHVHLKEFL